MSNKHKKGSKNKQQRQLNTKEPQIQIPEPQFTIPRTKPKNKRRQPYIECQLCCETYKKSKIAALCNCDHLFCKECLTRYSLQKIEVGQLITCPQQGCNKQINYSGEIFSKIPINLQERYKRVTKWRKIGQGPVMSECPQCQGKVTLLQNGKLQCSICNKNYCKECHMVEHKGNCQSQFQSQHQNYRRCPKCKIFIQKNEGCNHMTCTCFHQFCYICLSNWPHTCLLEDIPPNLINFIFYSKLNRISIGIFYILGFVIDLILSTISQNFNQFWQGTSTLLVDTLTLITERYKINSILLKILVFPALLIRVIVCRYGGNLCQLIKSTPYRYNILYYRYFDVKWLKQCFRYQLEIKNK